MQPDLAPSSATTAWSATHSSRSRARRDPWRPPWSRTRRWSTRCAIPRASTASSRSTGTRAPRPPTPVDDPDGLRRWKRREYLRIAARDLLGVADLPAVGRELAALAEVCLRRALLLAAPETPLAVIGMGKLGGRELNYASDVDVLFVHGGDQVEADNASRRLLAIMAEPSPAGIVFRTDADLRPEGRSGPLARSLDSYRAWYERWAQTWEFQALIKSRADRRRPGAHDRIHPSSSRHSSGRRCSVPTRCGPSAR